MVAPRSKDRKISYSSNWAKAVALFGFGLTFIPIASFVGLFIVQDITTKIILGIFVAIALLRIYWNAHNFKDMEFNATELLLKMRR